MSFQRASEFLFTALLLVPAAACVVRSEGGFVFSQGAERAERRETLPLELSAGEQLRVELLYGDISVRVAEGEAPHVDAHWTAHADDKQTAEAVLARYRLEPLRGNGSLDVRAVGEPLEIKSGFVTRRLAAGVELTLVVPSRVQLVAKSSSGDLRADGALGSCRLESSYGDLAASGVRGDTALETSSGDVIVEDIEAGTVDAASQYGNIGARNVKATRVRLSTSSGEVKVRNVQADLSMKSSYGDLTLEGSSGDLEAITSSGDIDVSVEGDARRKLVTSYGDVSVRGAGGDLEAKTSSGDVSVLEGKGRVSAVSSYGDVSVQGSWTQVEALTTSGEVEVLAAGGSTAGGPWKIASSYGDASLELPRDFSCELSASASSGSVQSPFSPRDGDERHELKHTIGDGGNSVEIQSASGDVRITTSGGSPRRI